MKSKRIPVEWLPRYTYADYSAWEGSWELIYGIPYAMSPSAKRVHQSTARKLVHLIENALSNNSGACNCEVFYELDWIINDNTVVRPDIMIVCGEFEDDFLRFPPSLIVEVTSKSTQIADRNVKFKLYEISGVNFYIIADPERQTIEVHALQDKHYQLTEKQSFVLGESCKIKMNLQAIW